MWWLLCRDLQSALPAAVIAQRFHCALAEGIVTMAARLA